METFLEKFWIPLWCSADTIRRETRADCINEDIEAAQARVRQPRPEGQGQGRQPLRVIGGVAENNPPIQPDQPDRIFRGSMIHQDEGIHETQQR